MFRNPNLACLLSFFVPCGSLVALGSRGCLGYKYLFCLADVTHGIMSLYVFCGFNLVGGVGGFAFGIHTSFVP